MHAISSYRGKRPHTQTHTHTNTKHSHKSHRQDRLQYTAPLSLARIVKMKTVERVSPVQCIREGSPVGASRLWWKDLWKR